MPLRVLHLLHWLNPGGLERWLLDMLAAVDRDRVRMDFCCKGPSVGRLAPLAESLGAHVWLLPFDWIHHRYARGLAGLVRAGRYDLIHNHLAVYAGLPALVARYQGVPTVLSFHNTGFSSGLPLPPLVRALRACYGFAGIELALRCASLVTVCSEGVLRCLSARHKVDPGKSSVLYYGVKIPPALSPDERRALRASVGVPPDAPLIAHLGSFKPQKNHTFLVRIAAGLLARQPCAHFVLAGEGRLRPQVERELAASGIAGSVHLLGARPDPERILQAADILLLPSLWEGFGLAALEAGAAGLPVVGSDVPGLREAVVAGETGLLLPLSSPEGFVAALDGLIADPARRASLGEAGRLRVAERFSCAVSARQLTAIYERCVRRP